MLDVRDESDVLTRFYDWLAQDGIKLARYGRVRERNVRCHKCMGSGIDTNRMSPRDRQLVAHGFTVTGGRCPACEGSGQRVEEYVDDESLAPIHESPARLFARFFGIDLDAADNEKKAILEALRAE